MIFCDQNGSGRQAMFQILVIDDDPITQLVLKRTLQKQGYQVEVAHNGQEGLAKAYEIEPALIICDWMMPVMDGLQVCQQVKAHPSLSTTFFILLTSRGGLEDRIQGLDTGADEFLSKPIEMSELRARVQAGLRLYQLNRDLQLQKQLLEAELAEAASYVRSLLPQPLIQPVQVDGRFIPSRQLGGDAFDYYWLDEQHLVIYLLDVSGHGLGAALPSVAVLNLLRSQSVQGINYYNPAEVLGTLNNSFQMSTQNDKYFTIWYGVYQRESQQLIYASAGHPPAILLSGNTASSLQVQKLKTVGLPIGMFPEVQFTNATCQVEPDSSLYVFSDGIYEIIQPDQQVWGIDRLIQLLLQLKADNLDDIDILLKQIYQVNATQSFDDDSSLLRARF